MYTMYSSGAKVGGEATQESSQEGRETETERGGRPGERGMNTHVQVHAKYGNCTMYILVVCVIGVHEYT